MKPGSDAQDLNRLLDARNEHPESLSEIDTEIWRRFGQTRAILVLDMCGFSRLTMRYGITHFLAMIRRLGVIVRPVVERSGGQVVKAEADDLFATFEDVGAAVACARSIHASLEAANAFLPEDWDLHAGIGIGYGPLLVVGGVDLFGSEMNLASKLGEDLAQKGEILLTSSAREQLPPSFPGLRDIPFETSGLELRAWRLEGPTPPP